MYPLLTIVFLVADICVFYEKKDERSEMATHQRNAAVVGAML